MYLVYVHTRTHMHAHSTTTMYMHACRGLNAAEVLPVNVSVMNPARVMYVSRINSEPDFQMYAFCTPPTKAGNYICYVCVCPHPANLWTGDSRCLTEGTGGLSDTCGNNEELHFSKTGSLKS